MSMQYGAVEYTPSSPNGNWTSLCQIAAQARSVGYAADRPNSEAGSDSTIPNFAYLRDLWDGKVDVPDIGALYNNNQTTYATDFMNNPASYMAGTKYFDAASQWYPSLQQNGWSGCCCTGRQCRGHPPCRPTGPAGRQSWESWNPNPPPSWDDRRRIQLSAPAQRSGTGKSSYRSGWRVCTPQPRTASTSRCPRGSSGRGAAAAATRSGSGGAPPSAGSACTSSPGCPSCSGCCPACSR